MALPILKIMGWDLIKATDYEDIKDDTEKCRDLPPFRTGGSTIRKNACRSGLSVIPEC